MWVFAYEKERDLIMNNKSIKNRQHQLKLRCINSKCGNFTVNKIYIATAFAIMNDKQYVDFKIEDDEHDLYTIKEKHLIKNNKLYFEII